LILAIEQAEGVVIQLVIFNFLSSKIIVKYKNVTLSRYEGDEEEVELTHPQSQVGICLGLCAFIDLKRI